MSVLNKFFSGDVAALSRLISEVENRSDGYEAIIAAVYPRTGRAYKIGITGPPGVGKSSLVDHLAVRASASGRVGILAADPSSPFSGGAFLGDRIRMQSATAVPGVYMRSMASRGTLGGLPAAAFDISLLLDAFGMTWIIMETVGVGQVELDVAGHVDTIVVVLSPEAGDAVQTAKAGLMEIGEIFVVNKADRPGASAFVTELNHTLDLKRREGAWHYPVLSTVATSGQGTEGLFAAICEHRRFLEAGGRLEARRRAQVREHLTCILKERIRAMVEERFRTDAELDHLTDLVCEKKESPYRAVDRILAEWRTTR
ncbi:MAG: methylmalonyl Co-A mutase-associated GTPase MeaB [Kiritimatiellae bacterium]|nr:methylmalonyl Co-A mutase-associated GTPase MeaB [Kiritimatiellia bacterium]